MPEDNQPSINEFIEILKSRKSGRTQKVVVFAGSAISRKEPSCMPVADTLLETTIDTILGCRGVRDVLTSCESREQVKQAIFYPFKKRLLPPEVLYDAIREYVGDKVFSIFDCLKDGHPNSNHRILTKLLKSGHIDRIVTTNFDSLLERSLPAKKFWWQKSQRHQIWKIHGDIDKPATMVATFRRVGQSCFDESMLAELKELLDDSDTLFIGYGGTDPDLRPALIGAKMRSVYWNVYDEKEFTEKSQSAPWTTIEKKDNGAPIKWIIGDLDKIFLSRVAAEIFLEGSPESENKTSDCPPTPQLQRNRSHPPLPTNTLCSTNQHLTMEQGKKEQGGVNAYLQQFESSWLDSPDANSISVLLQVLYNTAWVYPLSYESSAHTKDVWDMIGKICDIALGFPMDKSEGGNKLRRDLHSFRAEAHLQQGEMIEAKNHLILVIPEQMDDPIQAMAFLTTGTILSGIPGEKNREGAERMFYEVLRIAKALPDHERLQGQAHGNLALLKAMERRDDDALRHFETAAKFFREGGCLLQYIALRRNQGEYFSSLGYSKMERKCKVEAAKLEQDLSLTHLEKPENGGMMGILDKIFEKFRQSRDGDLVADWQLAKAIDLGNRGDWNKATEMLERIVAADPTDGKSHYYLLSAYLTSGEWVAAAKAARSADGQVGEQDSWKPRLLFPMGDAFIMMGEFTSAKDVLERAEVIISSDSSIGQELRARLKRLRAGQGEHLREELLAIKRRTGDLPETKTGVDMNSGKVRCADCNVEMTIITGMIPTKLILGGKVKNATQCESCHRSYCATCRPEDQPCQCGAKKWHARMYLC